MAAQSLRRITVDIRPRYESVCSPRSNRHIVELDHTRSYRRSRPLRRSYRVPTTATVRWADDQTDGADSARTPHAHDRRTRADDADTQQYRLPKFGDDILYRRNGAGRGDGWQRTITTGNNNRKQREDKQMNINETLQRRKEEKEIETESNINGHHHSLTHIDLLYSHY